MSVSVAMIVKNEEKVIRRCMKSAKLFADEIILVDTGSTDETMKIAREYTDKVFQSERFNSETEVKDFHFGLARNESLGKCTGDWIVWMDADDVIPKSSAKKIREIAQTQTPSFCYSFLVNTGDTSFEHVRMFPNKKGVLFDENHACHEFPLLKGLQSVRRRDITVFHHPLVDNNSRKRNLEILEQDYHVRGIKDARTMFYLANAYAENGCMKQALEMYDLYFEIADWKEEKLFARLYKAECLMRLSRRKEAKEELFLAMKEDDRFAEVYCALGNIAYLEEDYYAARKWYVMATDLKIPEDSVLFVRPECYGDRTWNAIRKCERHIRDEKKGITREEKDVFLSSVTPCVKVGKGLAEFFSVFTAAAKYVADGNKRIVLVSQDSNFEWVKSPQGIAIWDKPYSKQFFEVPSYNGKSRRQDYAALLGVSLDLEATMPSEWSELDIVLFQKNLFNKNIAVICREDESGKQFGEKQQWLELVRDMQEADIDVVFDVGSHTDFIEGSNKVFAKSSSAVKCLIVLSKFVITIGGWLHFLSASFGKPTTVLWETEEKQRLYGYDFQENVVLSDSSAICIGEKFSVKPVSG